MLTFISYALTASIIGTFFYFDGPAIVKNNYQLKLEKWKKLNELVSTKYDGYFTILWISIGMIMKALWINILQYLNSSITKLDKKTYELSYVLNGKLYKILINNKTGPRKVILVSDETQTDVSYLITPYLGPKEDFHGCVMTPEFFNRKELIFELSNGEEKIFKQNEPIII